MAKASIELIDAMYDIAERCRPITGRGVGYQLFAAKLIPSMSRPDMAKVYRLLVLAREREIIPWPWIVDETRSLEIVSTWSNPEEFAEACVRQYRKDYWDQQPKRVQVWSEKGTVRGLLAPVLNKYGVGFQVMHGFNGAAPVHDVAEDYDGRDLIVLYVGDFDPSGMCMSEVDLPKRLEKYNGDHVAITRIALLATDIPTLQTFPATDKSKDTRYKWFVKCYGHTCAELDAMDPNELRDRVDRHIDLQIEDRDAWERCMTVEKAERKSLRDVLGKWRCES
jgi:hypothetical protein